MNREETMRMKLLSICFALLFIVTGVHAADDPFAGTWIYNYDKSTHDKESAVKMKRVLEPFDGGMKFTRDAIGADGKPSHTVYIIKFDGKDYHAEGNPTGPTNSYKRIDANTMECTVKSPNGKVMKQLLVLSKDGKTFRLTESGNYASGGVANHVSVFEKQ
jgi:hypothetical protein